MKAQKFTESRIFPIGRAMNVCVFVYICLCISVHVCVCVCVCGVYFFAHSNKFSNNKLFTLMCISTA
jgi:hypothetical protein